MHSLIERLRASLAPEYQVERQLDSGGMGYVFLARDVRLDRAVAIKVIRPELATAAAVERFSREARILASIDHPNIVAVHRAGEASGLFYYVMEYLRGEPLSQRLGRGRAPTDEVVRLATDVLSALEAAHALGVIHRDLKPSNIFAEGQRYVVVDFGLAKAAAIPSSVSTAVGVGTPAYLPPEQAAGGPVSLRTDVYAAGAVIYEASSGRRWIAAPAPDEADWSNVPAALVPVLKRALAWAPADRWADARSFREALITAVTAREPLLPGRRLAAVMITDMVGYTALVESDEHAAGDARARIRGALDAAVPAHDGQLLQYTGDGCLSIFPSSVKAVYAALEVQRLLQTEPVLPLRIGIDEGEIAFDTQGPYGPAVNVAARLQNLAPAGQVVVSGKVFDEIENQRALRPTFLSSFQLKNVARPVDVYVVAPAGDQTGRASSRRLRVPLRRARNHESARRRTVLFRFGVALAAGAALALVVLAALVDPTPVIAVVPQAEPGGDPANAYMSGGLAEGIHSHLRGQATLEVISTASSFGFRDSTNRPQTIGRALGASALVFIRASVNDREVRISVQLVRVKDGVVLWDTLPTVRRDDVFILADRLSPAVAAALQGRLVPSAARPLTGGTRNAVAQEFYWEARELWRRRTPDALRAALQLFRSAVERDSSYALAHVGLADTYNMLGSFEYGVLPPDSAAEAARAAANRALALVHEFPPALAARANIRMNFDREWVAAAEDFRRAIELDPDFPDARQWLAVLLIARGHPDEAYSMLKAAKRNNENSALMFINIAQFHYLQSDYAQAHENIQRALDIDAGFSRAHALRALVLCMEGRASEAVPLLEQLTAYSGEDPLLAGLLGYAYGRADRRSDALNQLAWLKELGRKARYIPRESLAMIHLGVGDLDTTLDLLEEAADLRSSGMIYLSVEPMLAPLREHPRFKQLVQRVQQR